MEIEEMISATPEYLSLIKTFPLRKIISANENAAAAKVLLGLARREDDLTIEEQAYFQLLTTLVIEYEKKTFPAVEALSPRALLEVLMASHNLRQVDIVAQTGIIKTNLSSFLNGKRKLTRDEIGRLAVRFSVSPLSFVEDDHFGDIYMASKVDATPIVAENGD